MIQVALFLILLNGWGASFVRQEEKPESPSNATPVSESARLRLLALFPKEGDLAGTQVAEAPVFYGPDNLYEYINGASEAFIAYDFVALGHAVYKKGDAEIIVDVYDMGSPENAFGIYSSERSPESKTLSIGADAYHGDFMINFLQERFYVKLSGFSDSQSGSAFLEPFARHVSGKIGPPGKLPRMLSLFPVSDLVPRTQTYVKLAPLGREFLGPAYSARYLVDGKETVLMYSLARDAADARARVERLRGQLAKSGEAKPLAAPPEGFRGSNRYEGTILAFPRGSLAVIIINPPDREDAFISRVLSVAD